MKQTESGLYVAELADVPGVPKVPDLAIGTEPPAPAPGTTVNTERLREEGEARAMRERIRALPRRLRRQGMKAELAAMRRLRRSENRRASHVEKVLKGEISPMRKLPTVKS